MTQFVAITLKDRAAADAVFSNTNINYVNGVATWKNSGVSYDTGRLASFSLSIPTAKSTRCRIKAKMVIPLVDPLDSTKKIDELIANVEFVIPKQSVLTARQDLRALIVSFLGSDAIVAAVNNFEGVY